MAPTYANGTSRAASARVSRAGSTARDILKKRNKTYKTENQRVLAKRRKLDLHTSYNNLPSGYSFLPVGTSDLAERCKELSRLHGYSVNVVNAKPVSRYAHDPEKVSHHIARIGYHFRSDVLDQAVGELGYVQTRGRWIKEVDLERQQREAEQKQGILRTLAQWGLPRNLLEQNDLRETPEQVSAAIKELFPRIPDQDLKEIVRHAWEEGTDRVGTNNTLDLPRRVQLATIARIRHTYTDYDRLLRAFEWKEARGMVEQDCLQKLIEWRGENDEDQGDDALEEIVRETIVIDDDDDDQAVGRVSEADDEDSVTELEPGDTSDTSIEISHHVAADIDLGAESVDERARRLVDRYRPPQRAADPRTAITKQKISAAREKMRARPQPQHQSSSTQEAPRPVIEVGGIRVHPDRNGQYPAEVIIDGRRVAVPRASAQPNPREYRQPQATHPGAYSQQHTTDHGGLAAQLSPYAVSPALHDRPLASIERDDGAVRQSDPHVAPNGLRPVTPDGNHSVKRRRVDDLGAAPPVYVQGATPGQDRRMVRGPPPGAEVVSLISPDRPSRASPLTRREPGVTDHRDHWHLPHGANMHTRPPPHVGFASRPQSRQVASREPAPYDPSRPLLQQEPASEHIQYVRVYRPEPYQGHAPPPGGFVHAAAAPYSDTQSLQNGPYGQNGHILPGLGHYQPVQQSYVPQPIHGAPAPVQQMPAGRPQAAYLPSHMPGGAYGLESNGHYTNGEQARIQNVQADGAVAPTQYFYPR